MFSQPNLKCTQFSKYKKEYEEKIAVAEANIDKAIADCSDVTATHTRLSAEKNELVIALQSGGSAVQVIQHNNVGFENDPIQDIIDKTNRLEGAKNDLQKQVVFFSDIISTKL